MGTKIKRSASTFRGFVLPPEEVQRLVGVEAVLLAQSGQPMRPNRPNVWLRSAAKFEVEFTDVTLIVDMIPAILAHAGGVEHLCSVRDQVSPEFLEINLVLPIKHSVSHDDGYVESETLQDIGRLGATLGLSFL
ncbi:hypothetical protein [Massilia sp. PWRC2]|uniref:hypothetical protein n=1 Tax=Massilia sp. PWRC2 TaxID=2804626 RepID=UPI003CEC8CA6